MGNIIEKRNELLKEMMEYNHRGEELLNKMKEITLVDDMVERKDIIDVLPYLTRDEVVSVHKFIQNMLFPAKGEQNEDVPVCDFIISLGKYSGKNATVEEIYKSDNKWFMWMISNTYSDDKRQHQVDVMKEYYNSLDIQEKEEEIIILPSYEKDDTLPFDISETESDKDYSDEILSIGRKHKGKTFGEIYLSDPQYFEWLTKTYKAKNNDEEKEIELVKKFLEKGARL